MAVININIENINIRKNGKAVLKNIGIHIIAKRKNIRKDIINKLINQNVNVISVKKKNI